MATTVRWLAGDEVDDAEKILYECLVKNAFSEWNFTDSNPSKIRVEYDNQDGAPKLTDRFKHLAKWAGAFVEGRLVGVVRLVVPCAATDFKMEAQHYPSFPQQITERVVAVQGQDGFSSCVECNRIAVLPKFRGRGTMTKNYMVSFLARYCLETNVVMLGMVPIGFTGKVCMWIRDKAVVIGDFKYEATDEWPCYAIVCPRASLEFMRDKTLDRELSIMTNDGVVHEVKFKTYVALKVSKL